MSFVEGAYTYKNCNGCSNFVQFGALHDRFELKDKKCSTAPPPPP